MIINHKITLLNSKTVCHQEIVYGLEGYNTKTKFWWNNLVILTITPLKGPTVMNERQEAWTTFLINEQVKPGFTNYQPQDLAKTIWNFSSRLKNLENLQSCQNVKKTSIFNSFHSAWFYLFIYQKCCSRFLSFIHDCWALQRCGG